VHAPTSGGKELEQTGYHNLGSGVLTEGRRKQRMPRFVDQLKCGTRGKEKTSQTSDYVLVSMRKVATHDWSSCEQSPGCELCKRERGMGMASTDELPIETVAHIQSSCFSYEMAPFRMPLDRDTERSPRTRVLAVITRR